MPAALENTNFPVLQVLRLLCIQSVCNNGFKQKMLEYYKREILQVRVDYPGANLAVGWWCPIVLGAWTCRV